MYCFLRQCLTSEFRLASDLQCVSCLSLLSTGITGTLSFIDFKTKDTNGTDMIAPAKI